jgi:hypothetical protein
VPLDELEEHINQRQVEKERLQDEIEEALATIQSVNVDRQTIEDYKELKSETDKYLEDPKKFLKLLRSMMVNGSWQNSLSDAP